MKKKIAIILVLFFTLFMVTGCIQKTGDTQNNSVRPTAKGTPHSAQELEFYLPVGVERNPSSGSQNVYEYYSGEMKQSGPTGVDIWITIVPLTEEVDLKQYLETASYGNKDKVTYDTKNINDYKWNFAEDKKHQYYCVDFDGMIYDIVIYKNKEKDSVYQEIVKMFKKTLFFEHLEEN